MAFQFISQASTQIITRLGSTSTKTMSTQLESEGHPDLNNSEGPSTSKAYMANRNRRIQRDCKQQFAEQNNTNNVEQIDESPDETESKKRGEKRKRLSAYEVSEIILSKRLRNRTELLAFSNQQRQIWPSSLSTEVS